MIGVSLGCSVLLPALLVCAACGDLSLPRRAGSVPADTVSQDAASPPQPSRARSIGRRADAAVESAGFAEIRRALRRLVAVEETFFAENGTYTDDVSLTGLGPDKNVTVRFLWLSRDGWAASGRHAAVG